ncbi:hypothetical protein ACFSCZ_05175 [Siminovitchia sediminis]|uniref:Uncharacterized protein n=1 Tax=Siminovitchia sediminis TaxID=1274353 RepID=A0ABW4KEA3_9BACI
MGHCCCSSSSSPQIQYFFSQTEGTLPVPFGAGVETTVLTLPVTTAFDLQNVKLDYAVQLAFSISQGSSNVDHGVRVRLRRNGILLATQTFQQSGARNSSSAAVRREQIPNTWGDSGSLAGVNTYTVTVEYFQRANSTTTLSVETRSLNAIVFD